MRDCKFSAHWVRLIGEFAGSKLKALPAALLSISMIDSGDLVSCVCGGLYTITPLFWNNDSDVAK